MTGRLVWVWILATVAVQAALYWLVRALRPGIYSYPEFVSLLSLLAVPSAQWLALRVAGVAWRREWLTASIGGLVLSTTIVSLTWSSVARTAWPLTPAIVLAISEVFVALLQWVVLRAHVRRPSLWVVAALGTIVSTFALHWLMTGFAMSTRLPDSLWARLAVPAAAAVIQAVCFAWLLSSPRDDDGSLASHPAWFVLEWTTAGGVAMLAIIGGAGFMAAQMSTGDRMRWQFVLLPMLAGAVIGVMQWLVLRTHLPIGRSWVVLSTAALGLPAVGILEPTLMTTVAQVWFVTLMYPYAFALIGAWVGLAQWLVLRRYVGMAWLWVPAMALAFFSWHLRLAGVSYLTIGVLAGFVTGVVMAFLLRRPKAQPIAEPHGGYALQS